MGSLNLRPFMVSAMIRLWLASLLLFFVLSSDGWGRENVAAPEWLTAPHPKEEDLYTESEIARFEALQIDILPEQERAEWCVRFKRRCHVREGYSYGMCAEELSALVRLGDEETTRWLLSELLMGNDRSHEAGSILGKSGQAWVLPRLESALFSKPEDNPPPTGGDVVYGSISGQAMNAMCQIIDKSPVITARLKSWFRFVADGPRPYPSEGTQALLDWWRLNQETLKRGDFRRLKVLDLWPVEGATATDMSMPLVKEDFFSALSSPLSDIRRAALGKLYQLNAATWLTEQDRQKVITCFESFQGGRNIAAKILAHAYDKGKAVLLQALENDDKNMRETAAWALLEISPTSVEERARCLVEIVNTNESSSLANHPELRLEVLPLLRNRVMDESVTAEQRNKAAYALPYFVTSDDLPWLEALLSSSFPIAVRHYAAFAIVKVTPYGPRPEGLLRWRNDAELGPFLKEHHCLEYSQRPTKNESEVPYHRRLSAGRAAQIFASMMNLASSRDQDGYNHARDLALSGDRGISLLKTALSFNSPNGIILASGSAAVALIEENVPLSQEEKDQCISSLAGNLLTDAGTVARCLRAHPEFARAMFPLLITKLKAKRIPAEKKSVAARLMASVAQREDLDMLASLLDPSLPGNVRAAAVHGIFRLVPWEKAPEQVRALPEPDELSYVLKAWHYAK